MKFVCDRCQTKYSIADEKVRGKVLKVRCKTCANVITVRETAAHAAAAKPSSPSLSPVGKAAPAGRPARPSAALRAVGGGVPDPVTAPERSPELIDFQEGAERSERTQIAAPSAALMADAMKPQPRRSPTRPPAPPPAPDVQWFMAVDGEQQGPFTRAALVDKVLTLAKGADVHVWNEQLDGWKPPKDVPEIARDLQARRRPTMPPRPPSPPRGAPALPPAAASRSRSHLPAGASAAAAAAPVAASSGSGARLPPPSLSSSSFAPSPSPSRAPLSEDIDPLAMLETPAPQPDMLRPSKPSNGFGGPRGSGASGAHALGGAHGGGASGAHALGGARGSGASGAHALGGSGPAAAPVAPLSQGETSDALSVLNLAAAAAAAPASGAAEGPRLLRASQVVQAWTGPGSAQEAKAGRHRSAKLMLSLIAVVAVVIVIVTINVTRKPAPAVASAVKPVTSDNQFTSMAEKLAQENQAAKASGTAEPQPTAGPGTPEPGHSKVTVPSRSRAGARPVALARGPTSPPAHGSEVTSDEAPPPPDPVAARMRDPGERVVQAQSGSSSHAGPSQEAISHVIQQNKAGIKTCYQRALRFDSSLTHGKLTIRITVGMSGRVKGASVDGPAQFRTLEPCIRDVVSRWMFPPAPDEYGTEFVSTFQGNE